jgi:hypothetical protein
MLRYPLEQSRPYAGDLIQSLDSPETSIRLAILDDSPSQIRPDAGQPGDLRRQRPVEIHLLTLLERLPGRPRTVTVGQCRCRVRAGAAQHHDAARRVARIQKHTTRRLAGGRQADQQEHGAVFGGHAKKLRRVTCGGGMEKMRAGAEKDGQIDPNITHATRMGDACVAQRHAVPTIDPIPG